MVMAFLENFHLKTVILQTTRLIFYMVEFLLRTAMKRQFF